jgi:parvulin-like peptidyl-prolyl isomerase
MLKRKWLSAIVVMVLAGLVMVACDSAPAPVRKAGVPTATAVSAQPQAAPPTAVPQGPAAIVNGQEISMAVFLREVGRRQAPLIQRGVNVNTPQGQAELEQVKQLTLDNMIDDVLVMQDAAQQGISISDAEVEAEIQKGIATAGGQAKFEEQLNREGQTLEDARNTVRTQLLYQKMLAKVAGNLQTSEQVHARHILVNSAGVAQALLEQVRGGADFGQLAQQASLDTTTRTTGGDLGWFPRGKLVAKELEDGAFALQPGQVSEVIQSALGYHIIQTLERDPARKLEGNDLVDAQRLAVENWLNSLRSQAQVQRLAVQ